MKASIVNKHKIAGIFEKIHNKKGFIAEEEYKQAAFSLKGFRSKSTGVKAANMYRDNSSSSYAIPYYFQTPDRKLVNQRAFTKVPSRIYDKYESAASHRPKAAQSGTAISERDLHGTPV